MNNDYMQTPIIADKKLKRGSIPEIFGEGADFDKDNLVSYDKQVRNIYHLWLIDEIGEAKNFLKWYDILQSASEDDLVIIHINCWGGDVMTAVQLITQIKTCQANVVCQIESACCSAATMIALACDGLICYKHGYMMIHTSSGFTFGKQSDIKKEEEFYNKWLETFFNETYKHFLTKKEIDSILDGHDMWLVADDVVARFKKRVDTINRENARAKKEHMKQIQSFMSNISNISQNKAAVEGKPEPEKKEEDADKAKNRKKKPSKKPAKKNEETMEVK